MLVHDVHLNISIIGGRLVLILQVLRQSKKMWLPVQHLYSLLLTVVKIFLNRVSLTEVNQGLPLSYLLLGRKTIVGWGNPGHVDQTIKRYLETLEILRRRPNAQTSCNRPLSCEYTRPGSLLGMLAH